jgi:Signal peptide binding domain
MYSVNTVQLYIVGNVIAVSGVLQFRASAGNLLHCTPMWLLTYCLPTAPGLLLSLNNNTPQSTEAEIEAVTKKMMDETFDFNDYLKQSQMVKNMGSMAGVARMLPGMAGVYIIDRNTILTNVLHQTSLLASRMQ